MYLFNKNMPKEIFTQLAPVAERCKSLKFVLSYYDLPKMGWQNLSEVAVINSHLTGSGEGVRTIIYRVDNTSSRYKLPPRTRSLTRCEEAVDPRRALQLLRNFEASGRQAAVDYWTKDNVKVDISGTKFVMNEVGSPVRRSQREKGRGKIYADFVRRSLPSDLIPFDELQANYRPRSEKKAVKTPPSKPVSYRPRSLMKRRRLDLEAL